MAIRKKPVNTHFFKYYNANPKDKRTGDCVIRAMSLATGKSWDDVLDELVDESHRTKNSIGDCYETVLMNNGFIRMKAPKDDNGKKMTGDQFLGVINEMPEYVLGNRKIFANIGAHHVVCIAKDSDGYYKVFDTWNSSEYCIGKWWVKP